MGLFSGFGKKLKNALGDGRLLTGLEAAQATLNGDYSAAAHIQAAQRDRNAERDARKQAYDWAVGHGFGPEEAGMLSRDDWAIGRALLRADDAAARPAPQIGQPVAQPPAALPTSSPYGQAFRPNAAAEDEWSRRRRLSGFGSAYSPFFQPERRA